MKRLSYALLVISIVALGYAIVWASTRPVEVPEVQAAAKEELPLTRDNLLKLVNEERAKVGVAPLVIDERLNQSAQMKVDDMELNNNYAHKNSDGSQGASLTMKTAPGLCHYSSENLTFSETLTGVTLGGSIDSWVGSKPHYDAMVDPRYTLTGFGIGDNSVVQHLCLP